jgi:hypothetical protein
MTSYVRRITVCLICFALAATLGCDGRKKDKFFNTPGGAWGGSVGSTFTVRCFDAVSSLTVPGVICTLGDGQSKVTGGAGVITFKNVSGPQTVTAANSRYITTTIYHVNSQWLVVMLEPVIEAGYVTGTVNMTVLGVDAGTGDSSGIVRSRGREIASFLILGTTTTPSTLSFPVVAGRVTPLEVVIYDSSGDEVKSGQKTLWSPYQGAQNVTVRVAPADMAYSAKLVSGAIDNSAITKFTPEFGFSGSHAEIFHYTTMRFSDGTYDLDNNSFEVYVPPAWNSLSQSVWAGLGDNEGNLTYRQFNGNYFSLTGPALSGAVKDVPEITSSLVNVEPNGSITWDGVIGTSRYLLELTEQATGHKWRATVPGGTTAIDIPNAAGILALRNYTADIASETYDNFNYNWHYALRLPSRLTHRSEAASRELTTSGGGPGGGPITGDITVTVTDEFTHLPLADVEVYVDGLPTVFTTNSSGIALVDGVSGAQTVTLYKVDYESLTLFNIDAAEITFPLTPLYLSSTPLSNFEINLTELDCTSDAYTLYLSDMYAAAGMIVGGRPSPDDPILIDWPAGLQSHPAVLVYDNTATGPTRYGYTILPPSTQGTVAINIVPRELITYGVDFQTLLGSLDNSGITGFVPIQGVVEAFAVLADCSSVFTGAADYFLGNGFFDGGIFDILEATRYRLEASVENAAGHFSVSMVNGDFSDFAGVSQNITLKDIPTATSSFSSPPAEMPVSWTAVPGTSYYAIAIDGPDFFWYGIVPGSMTSVTVPADVGLAPGINYGCSIETHTVNNFDYNQFTPLSVRANRTSLSIWVFGGTFTVSP